MNNPNKPRGGDKRALEPPTGRAIHYASLLFKYLWKEPTFREAYADLYRQWYRWISAVSNARHLSTSNDDINAGLREIYAEDEREPTEKELLPQGRRSPNIFSAVVEDAEHDLMTNVGYYTGVGRFKPRRVKPRPMVLKYRQSVQEFCTRWRLDAPWALSAIIHHQFMSYEDPSLYEEEHPLLLYGHAITERLEIPVTVKLPRRSDEDFVKDRERALAIEQTILLETEHGPIAVTRHKVTRQDRAVWETQEDLACVVIPWDGHRDLRWDTDAKRNVTLANYAQQEVEARLGRNLTYREQRDLTSEVWEQEQQWHPYLEQLGWSAPADTEPWETPAQLVAQLLVKPGRTYTNLADLHVKEYDGDEIDEGDQYQYETHVRRACQNFAKLANLTLPAKRRGRPSASS